VAGLQKQISAWHAKESGREQAIASKDVERDQELANFPKGLAEQYKKLRTIKRTGPAIVPIRKEQCSGCHMKVSQNTINEVRRGQKLMTCESCSRILYIEEVLTDASSEQRAASS